jgi:ankyrin repeat protein
VRDHEGDSVLHWVVREKTYAMLNYLLQKGCNPNISNEDGETPLHLAACLGEDLSVDCLLKHGANATLLDSNGQTPLDVAVESGEKKVIDLLAKFKRAPPRGSRSPQRCATTFNNYERKGFLSPHSTVSSPLLSFQTGSSF